MAMPSLRWSPLFVLVVVPLVAACGRDRAVDERARGRELYQACASCHGADGSGNRALRAPAIAGLDAWYVSAQLGKFKQGTRGAHPDDVEGARMRAAAQALRSERDLAAVAEHVAQLPPSPGPAVVAGDAGRGRSLWGTCAVCHGALANGDRASGAPPLDKSDDAYLLAQLGKFRRGVRGSVDDPAGARMRPVARALPDDRAMSDLVAYIVSLR